MRTRRLLAPATLLALAGCQGGETASHASTAPPKPVVVVPPPSTTAGTVIALVRRGQSVTVGMRSDDAFKVFRDTRDGGFEYEQIPPGFETNYRARSWETGDRGFGVLTYNDRVAAAMYQESRATLERVDEFVAVHQDRLGVLRPEIVAGRKIRYWFWESDGQRLMICALQSERKGISITTCMGDQGVLDALGASPRHARETLAKVDRALVLPEEVPKGSAK